MFFFTTNNAFFKYIKMGFYAMHTVVSFILNHVDSSISKQYPARKPDGPFIIPGPNGHEQVSTDEGHDANLCEEFRKFFTLGGYSGT